MNLVDVEVFCDNIGKPNKKRRRKLFMLMGSMSVFFLFGTMFMLPLFNNKTGMDILGELVADDTVMDVHGDEPPPEEPDSPAFDYWYAPSNSFGISETKDVNWTHFKNLFKNNFDYLLEYRISDTWVEGNEYLSIGFDWQGNESGYWKINLTFTKPPSPSMDVRFTIGMNKQVMSYVEKAGQYEYWINYTANETEVYNCFFNWSDLMGIPDLVFNHGVTDDLFWFRFRKDDVPLNTEEKVYVFDPTFGYTYDEGSCQMQYGSNNFIRGAFYEAPVDCTADSISVYFTSTARNYDYECAIYEYTDYSSAFAGAKVDTTETKEVAGTGDITFDFGTPPSLTGGVKYYLCIRVAEDGGGPGGGAYAGEDSGYNNVAFEKVSTSEPAFDDPLTGDSADAETPAIYCTYTATGGEPVAPDTPPTIETDFNNGSYEQPIAFNFSTVWFNDSEGDIDNNWMNCSNGQFWSVNNSNVTGYIELTGLNYYEKYWVNCSSSDINNNTLTNYWFYTANDSVTVTLIDYSPADILISSSELAYFVYNITTGGTLIDPFSIVWAYSINHTEVNNHLTHYSLEDYLAQNKLRGYNRNENTTIETKFDNITGDSSIGGLGEWNVHTVGDSEMTIVASGSNWTLVNVTESETEHLFSHISLVDEEHIREENKDGKTLEVSKTDYVKIEFNMTDTNFYDSPHYNNTLYALHFYANETSANKPLQVYFANSSYTAGQPSGSSFCEPIGTIAQGEDYHLTGDESNYYELDFSTTEAGLVGTVAMTPKFYIIFTSDAPSAKMWWIHYADTNESHLVNGDSIYHDFDNHTLVEMTDDSGSSWTTNSSTPDVYFNYINLNEEDKVSVKLYANDTSGNEKWSIVHTDLIDITNYPPNNPEVVLPDNDTQFIYTIGETMNITYNWLGDPNHETCFVNITVHSDESEDIAYWVQNRSITDAETHVNNTWWFDWDTTGAARGIYHINITATDPDDETAWGEQNGTFKLNDWLQVEEWNVTISNVTATWQQQQEWNLTISDSSSWQQIEEWNITLSNASSFQIIETWNLTISNVTNIWNQETEWNLTISDSSSWDTLQNWNITISDTSNWLQISEWNVTISNVTSSWQQQSEWNLTISDTSNNQTINEWNLTISDSSNFQTINNWNITISNTTNIWNQETEWNLTIINGTGLGPTITITNIYATGLGIPIQPTLYITINSTTGKTMNVTWKHNTITLGTNINITNSTIYKLHFPATSRMTTYTWNIITNDGTNWLNETYSFTTEGYAGAGTYIPRSTNIIGILGLLGLIGILVIIYKKKKNDGDK